jgi:ABC-type Fe3+-siderophore transport system permease subunit
LNCPNCGTSNLDNAAICINCGRSLAPGAANTYTPPPPSQPYGGAPAAGGPAVPNYLWQSIVVTLCCCLPLGVVGIIFAAQVNSKLAQGDIAGARDASQKAKMFTMIGFVVGLIGILIWFALSGMTMLQAFNEARANG